MPWAGVREMLRDIRMEIDYTARAIGRHAFSEPVMQAMTEVPRHRFVPPDLEPQAYTNGPLPIGHGQTISQPFIVALMTELLDPRPDHVILEIGTGSGYQAAILSRLVKYVYTLEIIEELSLTARNTLEAEGYRNVICRISDGYYGWAEKGPFDGIVVTAAAERIPPPLVQQLKPGARLVIPVGPAYGYQELVVVEKLNKEELRVEEILGVAFVPLTGGPRGNTDD